MTPLLLSVVLVSGYLFVINSLPTRYRFKRSEGWNAYFFVAAWGILFFSIGWITCSFLGLVGITGKVALWFGFSKENLSNLIPLSGSNRDAYVKQDLKIAFWIITSTSLAFLSGTFIRGVYWFSRSLKYKAIVKAARNNPLEELVIEAASTLFPIIVTLKSKKVYVGWLRNPVLEHGKIEFLSVIPLLSGFRDKDKLTVTMTTNYREHYSESGIVDRTSRLTFDNFRVVLPASEIENISLFDFDTYAKFTEKDKKNESQRKKTPRNQGKKDLTVKPLITVANNKK